MNRTDAGGYPYEILHIRISVPAESDVASQRAESPSGSTLPPAPKAPESKCIANVRRRDVWGVELPARKFAMTPK